MKKIVNGITAGVRIFAILISVMTIFMSGFFIGGYISYRSHWNVTTKENEFTESAKQLQNPNRGFYSMYGFVICDAEQNYSRQLEQNMYEDRYALSLIQINLREYKDRALTEEALANIEALFQALATREKQYIIRFLYDWNGKAEETEPEEITYILEHIGQLEEVLAKYSQSIFCLQGIFVGDCGEMHGSSHMDEESMKLLIQQLHKVTPKDIFLSVRTPQHWRLVTGIAEVEQIAAGSLASRLGLYNDGMMGTLLDTGTYGTVTKDKAGATGKWTREEELDFQQELCRLVPNGGEVILENEVNDFENAVHSLATMHVTYLNGAYDESVLEKWANTVVTEEGCFDGMDGLSYIERHLGYRLLLEDVELKYAFLPDKLNLTVQLKNVGFAPIYKEPEAYFVFVQRDTENIRVYPVKADISSLSGGYNAADILSVTKEVSLAGETAGEYEVFFYLWDRDSSSIIELANEEPLQEYGYLIGTFYVEEKR